MNPWNLTPRQVQILSALVASSGESRRAASLLATTVGNVDITVSRAKERMAVPSRFDVLLMWDRWVNQQRGRV